jgi:purine-binding chemotaxis protein CheW
VREVLRIPKLVIEEPPEMVTSSKTEFISSVGKLEDRLLILIDLKKILSKNEQNQIKEVV